MQLFTMLENTPFGIIGLWFLAIKRHISSKSSPFCHKVSNMHYSINALTSSINDWATKLLSKRFSRLPTISLIRSADSFERSKLALSLCPHRSQVKSQNRLPFSRQPQRPLLCWQTCFSRMRTNCSRCHSLVVRIQSWPDWFLVFLTLIEAFPFCIVVPSTCKWETLVL